MKYHNFIIQASGYQVERTEDRRHIGRFNLWVIESPAGNMSPDQAVTVEFDVRELQQAKNDLARRSLDHTGMVAFGHMLADNIFPPAKPFATKSLREFFYESRAKLDPDDGLRLRLRLPPDLAVYPWEYIYTDRPGGGEGMDGFLALDPRIAIVRDQVLEAPSELEPFEGDIKVVVALASPTRHMPLLDIQEERQNIEKAFSGHKGLNPEYLMDANFKDVQEKIIGAGVFHFAGHGKFVRQQNATPGKYTGTGSLVLDDKDVEAEQLGINLRGNGVRLAVLGGCVTGQSESISWWEGVAPALVKAEIPAVVANQFTVKDDCAIAFSSHFYHSLAGGLSIERAVNVGRIAAYNADKDCRDWGSTVIYLRAKNGQLFQGAADLGVREQARKDSLANISVYIREVNNIDLHIDNLEFVGEKTEIYTNMDRELAEVMTDAIVSKLAARLGLDDARVDQLSSRPISENESQQIQYVISAQKELTSRGLQASAETFNHLGRIAIYQRDYEEAISYFRQATQADPEYSAAWEATMWLQQTRAKHDIQVRDYAAAESKLAEASIAAKHSDPLDTRALTLRGYIAETKAQIAKERGDTSGFQEYLREAESFFKHVVNLDPNDAGAWNGLGNIQAHLEDHDSAIESYQRAINLIPAYTAAYNDLGLSYVAKMMVAKEEANHALAEEWCLKAVDALQNAYKLSKYDPGFLETYRMNLERYIQWLKSQCGPTTNDGLMGNN